MSNKSNLFRLNKSSYLSNSQARMKGFPGGDGSSFVNLMRLAPSLSRFDPAALYKHKLCCNSWLKLQSQAHHNMNIPVGSRPIILCLYLGINLLKLLLESNAPVNVVEVPRHQVLNKVPIKSCNNRKIFKVIFNK